MFERLRRYLDGRSEQPQQERHDHQAEAGAECVEDDVVDVYGAVASPDSRDELNDLDSYRYRDRDQDAFAEAATSPDQRYEQAQREEQKKIAFRIVHAEMPLFGSWSQARGRACKDCQIGAELDAGGVFDEQPRIVIGLERCCRESAEVDDGDEQEELAQWLESS